MHRNTGWLKRLDWNKTWTTLNKPAGKVVIAVHWNCTSLYNCKIIIPRSFISAQNIIWKPGPYHNYPPQCRNTFSSEKGMSKMLLHLEKESKRLPLGNNTVQHDPFQQSKEAAAPSRNCISEATDRAYGKMMPSWCIIYLLFRPTGIHRCTQHIFLRNHQQSFHFLFHWQNIICTTRCETQAAMMVTWPLLWYFSFVWDEMKKCYTCSMKDGANAHMTSSRRWGIHVG